MNNVSRHEVSATIAGLLAQVEQAELERAKDRRAAAFRDIRAEISRLQRQIRFTEEFEEIGIHPPCWLPLVQLVTAPENLAIVIGPELGMFEIFADPLITKVFRYLAENTLKHGFHATEIRFGAAEAGNRLMVTVEDNGTGIPVKDKKKIFRRAGGDRAGMGLFLVREILAITGIAIEETGLPGKGARFEILVPEMSYRKQA